MLTRSMTQAWRTAQRGNSVGASAGAIESQPVGSENRRTMTGAVEVELRDRGASGSSDTADNVVVGERETWGHKAEFILASIGLAVGLGNIWRFPYLCQKNGGGAFLIPYFIFMVLEGLPLFIIEFGIGQRFRSSAVKCWNQIHPTLFGVGISSLIVSIFLCIYYVIVLSWCTYYFYRSFTDNLPWDPKNCINYKPYKALTDNLTLFENMNQSDAIVAQTTLSLKHKVGNFSDCCVRDAAMWFWYHNTLEISPSISDMGVGMNGKLAICLVIAWIATYLCIVKGIKSSGKVVYFTAVFPYIVLIILFFRGVTLDGAGDGIKTFFTPDWSRLKEAQIWKDAATQMFFTLSLGFGALIGFASYMPRKNNCVADAYLVVLINCGTSIFAGIVVFSILGYREKRTGIPATKVGSGPGLAFMTFSEALLLMEVSPLWAILFFFMLMLLGIDSEFGTLEAAIGPLYDLKIVPKMRKELFTALLAIGMFLIGLLMVTGPGFYLFQIFDDYSVTLPLLFIAFFQVVGVSWVYGNENFANDIEYMTGRRPSLFWLVCWKYLSPIALMVVFISSCVDIASKEPKYTAYVGCEQDPFTSQHVGTETWTEKFIYPVWGKIIIGLIIVSAIIPTPIWIIKNWPRNWRSAFRRTFLNLHNYHPDPAMVDPSRRKTVEEMEAEIRAQEKTDALSG